LNSVRDNKRKTHRVPDPLRREWHKLARDPVHFARRWLGVRLFRCQQRILRAVRDHDRVAVRSSHGTGKTFSVATTALWFLYSFGPDAKVITTAPTWRQVETQIWAEIRRRHTGARLPLGGSLRKTSLALAANWFALGLSTDDPARFEGYHAPNILFIVDEAKGVRRDIFGAIQGALSTGKRHGGTARLLLTSTPGSPSGYFYDCFTRWRADWRLIHIGPADSPLVSPEWVEQCRRQWGEHSAVYQARVLGDFPTEGIDTLIGLSTIEAARDLSLEPQGDVHIGVDVARYGDDLTVLLARQGGVILDVQHYQGKATTEVAGLASRMARKYIANGKEHHVHLKIDDTGVGGGVTDLLREQGIPVAPVNFAAAPIDREHFANLRAELCRVVKRALEQGRLALPEHEALAAQLAAPKYRTNSRGRLQLEPKEQTKRRLGASPDFADALAISFASTDGAKLRLWLL